MRLSTYPYLSCHQVEVGDCDCKLNDLIESDCIGFIFIYFECILIDRSMNAFACIWACWGWCIISQHPSITINITQMNPHACIHPQNASKSWNVPTSINQSTDRWISCWLMPINELIDVLLAGYMDCNLVDWRHSSLYSVSDGP